MTILANGGILTASYVYSGYGDYFGGHGCADDEDRKEFLLYAFYGRKTSLADIVDDLVSDCYVGPVGEDLPDDITEDDVRDAIMTDMLNDRGRADVVAGAIAECSADYADANNLNVCRDCGAELGDEHKDDCSYVAEWRESGEWTEDESPEVIEEDCKSDDDDDCGESPIFVVILKYELPEAPADPTSCPEYDGEVGCAKCSAYDECGDREECKGCYCAPCECLPNDCNCDPE